MSDNGPQFISEEFSKFCRANGIKHIRSAPYHPTTNGIIERFVQTFKKALKAGKKEGKSLPYVVSNFLLKYRSIPHSVTGAAPCSLMLKFGVRTVLDLVKPDYENRVKNKQADQKMNFDKRSKERSFEIGQKVMTRNYRSKQDKCIAGVIVSKKGDLTYIVKLSNGSCCKRHCDQIMPRAEVCNEGDDSHNDWFDVMVSVGSSDVSTPSNETEGTGLDNDIVSAVQTQDSSEATPLVETEYNSPTSEADTSSVSSYPK